MTDAKTHAKHAYRTGQVNDEGKQICGAKTRAGTPCAQTLICANGRCRMHNGKAAMGVNAAAFKHGRYSKAIPSRMLHRYEKARTDPTLLEQTEEIALIDGRLGELLTDVDQGGSASLWREIQTINKALWKGLLDQDDAAVTQAMRQFDSVVGRIGKDLSTWDDVYKLIEQRRRVVESERKRWHEMGMMVSEVRLLTVIERLMHIVEGRVSDVDERRGVAQDIYGLVNEIAVGDGAAVGALPTG